MKSIIPFNDYAIFIFTKDRPSTLNKTLELIQFTAYKKYIIDDSAKIEYRLKTLKVCCRYPNCIYLGKTELNKFILEHEISFPKFNFLLKEIGSDEWNLGYARNFGLLYSKYLGLEKVLFMDDDIEVLNQHLIQKLFNALNHYKFTGANILGLVDDSILGHIATELGIFNERMLSGGFMIFNPRIIDHFFLNNYNEDWIWLFLQLKGEKYLQIGEVFQKFTDPFTNYKSKVMFQEFGEIALDGILDLYKEGSYDSLIQLSFWKRMIQERKEYLDLLASKTNDLGNKKSLDIVTLVKNNSENFDAELFQKLFEVYFSNRIKFLKLYSSL